MPPARLILIEGMIGTGKSTTAAQLARWLTGHGADASVYHEFADDHPIRTKAIDLLRTAFDVTAPPDVGADGLAKDPAVYSLNQWTRLASRCQDGQQTIILESAFLQNSVLPTFAEGAPVDEVNAVFVDIDSRIAPIDPMLIYLRPSDIDQAVTRVHRERGEAWAAQNAAWVSNYPWARRRGLTGRQAVVELYRVWEKLVDDLLATSACTVLLLVDPQNDWDTALERIYAATRP